MPQKNPGVRGSLSAVAFLTAVALAKEVAKEGAPRYAVEQSPDPTTTMEPKHDINVEMSQKSPDESLVNWNDVNLGFNTLRPLHWTKSTQILPKNQKLIMSKELRTLDGLDSSPLDWLFITPRLQVN